jgi:hypothetical protein
MGSFLYNPNGEARLISGGLALTYFYGRPHLGRFIDHTPLN